MCGHVGVASKILSEPVRKAFYDMLYLDVLRGEDSTGVAAISKPFEAGTEIEVFKSVGSASDFFYDHAKYKKGRDFTNKPVGVFIGHNRFATQGAVNVDNAHPFEFDNVVGAHNGTVLQSSLYTFHGYKDFNVDSQIIYSHLSHTGSIDAVWEKADGALALVWWDKTNNKLNMIRNNQRDLHVVYTEDDKTVLWASEAWMFHVGAARHGVKLKQPIQLKPNRLYTFSNTEDGKMVHEERDLPPFVAPVYTNYFSRFGTSYSYQNWDDDDWEYGSTTSRVPPKKEREESKKSEDKKTNKDNILVIREFNDIPHLPSAIAFTSDGRSVRVNIPLAKGQEAKNKIIGRGMSSGYYVAKKVYKSHVSGNDLWCNWADLSYVKLKRPAGILKTEGGGFELYNPSKSEGGEYAPWYAPELSLTQGAWQHRTGCGCVSCHSVPNWGQRNELKWVGADTFFCLDCQDLPLVKDLIEEHKQQKSA